MSDITFVFRSAPHGSARGREGVDAVLAASAYCDDICVIFVSDGVNLLLDGQDTHDILTKNFVPMLKLFELYDIEQVFVCRDSLQERGLGHAPLIIDIPALSRQEIADKLHIANKVLTF